MLLHVDLTSNLESYLEVWEYLREVVLELLKADGISLVNLAIVVIFLLKHLVGKMD